MTERLSAGESHSPIYDVRRSLVAGCRMNGLGDKMEGGRPVRGERRQNSVWAWETVVGMGQVVESRDSF